MSTDEKLDRIIELLEKLARRQPAITYIPSEARPLIPPKRCTCTGMRIGKLHNYGCPLYKRLTVRG